MRRRGSELNYRAHCGGDLITLLGASSHWSSQPFVDTLIANMCVCLEDFRTDTGQVMMTPSRIVEQVGAVGHIDSTF